MASTGRKAAAAAAAAAAMSDGPTGFMGRISSIPRLVRDVLLGRYEGLSRGRLLLKGHLMFRRFVTGRLLRLTAHFPRGQLRGCVAMAVTPTPEGWRWGGPEDQCEP